MRPFDFVFSSEQDERRHFAHRFEVPRPARANTQWLRFAYRSIGLQRHSSASHWAVVLRARLGFDAHGLPISISGRGMTLGDTSLAVAPPNNPFAQRAGFGGARGAQVESFWPGGNFLYRQVRLFDAGVRDGGWYAVVLEVDDDRSIRFGLAEVDEPAITVDAMIAVTDAADHPVIADATGLVICLGRGPFETGPWSAEFRGIRCGWR